jgi:hypothetical protein
MQGAPPDALGQFLVLTTAMKTLLTVFLLLAAGRVQAQFFSLKELLLLAEKADQEYFQGKQTFEVQKMLRKGGFMSVRWREDDPDIGYNPGSSKAYSRRTDAFLIFQADGHGRLLEELEYRVRSPACVAQLRKQLLTAGFVDQNSEVLPAEDQNAVVRHFSPSYQHYLNPEYVVTIMSEVDAVGNDLHRYSVSIQREAAMRQMQAEINAVNEEVQRANRAKLIPKPPQR